MKTRAQQIEEAARRAYAASFGTTGHPVLNCALADLRDALALPADPKPLRYLLIEGALRKADAELVRLKYDPENSTRLAIRYALSLGGHDACEDMPSETAAAIFKDGLEALKPAATFAGLVPLKDRLNAQVRQALSQPPERDYTVLLLYPDYAADQYGLDTYMAHVEAEDPHAAIIKAGKEAEAANGEIGGKAEDFHCLLCIAGHHEDLGATPVLEIVK